MELKGRKLVIMKALSRDNLQQKLSTEDVKTDPRNLLSTKFGLLNTKEFQLDGNISEIDMRTRTRLYQSKTKALKKNPNLFVSATRICIRNLPRTFTEKEVKELITHFIEEWKHTLDFEFMKSHDLKTKKVIHQIKVLRDPTSIEEGQAKPKGMGFVEVEYPEASQYLIKKLNNFVLSKKTGRGLICELALEDHRTLLKRR